MGIINIEISSEDFYGENTKNIHKAVKRENDDGYEYLYMDEFGQSIIVVKNGLVEIKRNGEIKSTATFIKGEKSRFLYSSAYLTRDFEMFCDELLIEKNRIFLKYTLYDADTMVNVLKIIVREGM